MSGYRPSSVGASTASTTTPAAPAAPVVFRTHINACISHFTPGWYLVEYGWYEYQSVSTEVVNTSYIDAKLGMADRLLHKAASRKGVAPSAFRKLIMDGADVHSRDPLDGVTALHLAVS